MPGGRLTQREREQIVAGLADNLAYAEIARRLGRPTSTVTREVIRNGGPNGYRAGDAQRATGDRARRRKAAPATSPPADNRDTPAMREFRERLIGLMTRAGLPRTAATVLACLYLTDSGSLTAAELAQRLRVSPATISKAVGLLEIQTLIRRERDEAGRRDRYVLDDDIWYRSWLASAQANARMVAAAREGIQLLGTGTPAGTRLENMSHFLSRLSQEMIDAAERYRRDTSA